MATLDDVARIALSLPGVTEGTTHGHRAWSVAGKAFAWERAFSKADLKRFGDEPPPEGPVVALSVEDLGEKEAVLQAGHDGVFTIPHFNNYPAVLIALPAVSDETLREAITDAWLSRAPDALTKDHLTD